MQEGQLEEHYRRALRRSQLTTVARRGRHRSLHYSYL